MDKEKVLTWLEICGKNNDCSGCCPYSENGFGEYGRCRESLMADAYDLLKDQQAEIEQLRNDANARRCKDCKNKECCGRAGNVVCGIDGTPHRPDWFCTDFDPSDEAVLRAFAENG